VVTTEGEKLFLRDPRHKGVDKTYTFDRVYGEKETNDDIFDEEFGIDTLSKLYKGQNITVFAHGATGSGKTFTMQGCGDENEGIVPQCISTLFELLKQQKDEYVLRFSLYEIYCGKVRDLLQDPEDNQSQKYRSDDLQIQKDHNGFEVISQIKWEILESPAHFARLYRNLLKRATEQTEMNETSSRSHCCAQINVEKVGSEKKAELKRGSAMTFHSQQPMAQIGRLFLVDLAGCEDNRKTGNRGQRMTESSYINETYLALVKVFTALKTNKPLSAFCRDAKLTRLLRGALEDKNSPAWVFITISPSICRFQATLNTFSYLQFSGEPAAGSLSARKLKSGGKSKSDEDRPAADNKIAISDRNATRAARTGQQRAWKKSPSSGLLSADSVSSRIGFSSEEPPSKKSSPRFSPDSTPRESAKKPLEREAVISRRKGPSSDPSSKSMLSSRNDMTPRAAAEKRLERGAARQGSCSQQQTGSLSLLEPSSSKSTPSSRDNITPQAGTGKRSEQPARPSCSRQQAPRRQKDYPPSSSLEGPFSRMEEDYLKEEFLMRGNTVQVNPKQQVPRKAHTTAEGPCSAGVVPLVRRSVPGWSSRASGAQSLGKEESYRIRDPISSSPSPKADDDMKASSKEESYKVRDPISSFPSLKAEEKGRHDYDDDMKASSASAQRSERRREEDRIWDYDKKSLFPDVRPPQQEKPDGALLVGARELRSENVWDDTGAISCVPSRERSVSPRFKRSVPLAGLGGDLSRREVALPPPENSDAGRNYEKNYLFASHSSAPSRQRSVSLLSDLSSEVALPSPENLDPPSIYSRVSREDFFVPDDLSTSKNLSKFTPTLGHGDTHQFAPLDSSQSPIPTPALARVLQPTYHQSTNVNGGFDDKRLQSSRQPTNSPGVGGSRRKNGDGKGKALQRSSSGSLRKNQVH